MLYRPCVKSTSQLYFTSGQLPTVEGQEGFADDFRSQANATLNNLLALVKAEGGNKDSFVKITVFLADFDYFPLFNEIYTTFFEGHSVPARTCVEVSRLPKDAMIEAEAIFQIEQPQ